jgi:hypothetical protein
MEQEERKPETPRSRRGWPRVRLGAVLALALGGGLAAWAVVGGQGSESSSPTGASTSEPLTTTAKPVGPIGLSAQGLRTLTESVDDPIYWAGPKPGYLYELTRTSTGKVFIRYLPPGVKAGAKQAIYLIVATYPFRNALETLENVTKSDQLAIPGGGIAVVDQDRPQSVHLAFPGVDDQIEVYDPSPARALQVALSGDVRPVTP